MSKTIGTRAREGDALPVPLVVGLLCSGMAFNAFDGEAGQALCAILNASLCYALVLRGRPAWGFWRRALPVLALAGAALLWAIFATWTVSDTIPDYALGKILAFCAGVAALLVGAMLARGRRRRGAILDALLLCNGAILLLGLLFRASGVDGAPIWTLERLGRFTGLAGNANVTAAMAGCCVMIAFVRLAGTAGRPAWARRRAEAAYVNLPLLAIGAGAVAITGSRFTATLLCGLILLLLVRWAMTRAVTIGRAVAVAACAMILLLIGALFSALLAERYEGLGASWDDRVATWSHLWNVAMERPLFGYGLGAFPSVNAQFLTSPRYAQANWAINSPHDIGLQMLLQAGWPYLLLVVAAAMVATRQVLIALKGRWTADDGLIAVLLALLLACASVDLVLDMPAPLTQFLFLAGLLWGQALDRAEVRITAPRL